MKIKMLVVTLTLPLLLLASQALATPVIDGAIGLGEWDVSPDLFINAFDPNEGDIPNAYDIKRIAMFSEDGGGGLGNGLYILAELYGTPTFTSLDTLPPIDPVFYSIGFDLNQDGDFLDSIDRVADYRATGFVVYDGFGSSVAGTTANSMGSVVELFVSSSMYTANDFNGFALLDNGGAPPDDRLPDTSYFTNVPEPSSMLMLGMGLVGLVGRVTRKKVRA